MDEARERETEVLRQRRDALDAEAAAAQAAYAKARDAARALVAASLKAYREAGGD